MILILILGGSLGLTVNRARVQREAVGAIRRAGGNVLYDWQWKKGRSFPGGKPRWPQWLVDQVGVDYLGSVVFVFLPEGGSDHEMAKIGRLSHVETLLIRSPRVTDAGLANLKHLAHLEKAMFANCPIDDEGLPTLKRLRRLRELSFYNTKISAAGAKALQRTLPAAKIEL